MSCPLTLASPVETKAKSRHNLGEVLAKAMDPLEEKEFYKAIADLCRQNGYGMARERARSHRSVSMAAASVAERMIFGASSPKVIVFELNGLSLAIIGREVIKFEADRIGHELNPIVDHGVIRNHKLPCRVPLYGGAIDGPQFVILLKSFGDNRVNTDGIVKVLLGSGADYFLIQPA